MTVDRIELNNALIVYLGGGRERGILPYGQKERLRAAFPENSDDLLNECEKIIALLDCDEKVLQTGDLVQIGNNASEQIKKRVDWLEDIVANKLGNYYSYQMR
jgi:hypothetical protein